MKQRPNFDLKGFRKNMKKLRIKRLKDTIMNILSWIH